MPPAAMAAATPYILAGTAALAAGTAGYQISEAEAAKSNAQDEAGKQKQIQAKALADAEAQKKKEQEDLAATQAAEDAKAQSLFQRDEDKRLRSLYGSGASGRRGTILTSPLGKVGESGAGTARTLLGA